MKYQVRHSVDQSGARYCGEGMLDYEGEDFNAAQQIASEFTAIGQCGYVIRVHDGAVLAPDESWIVDQ